MPSILNIDFETYSTVDLRKTGSDVYSRHSDTGVSVMAYAFDDEPVQFWKRCEAFPQRIIQHVLAGDQVHAWNAMFEFNIWNNVLTRYFSNLPQLLLTQLHCSMARAAYWGLPMSLDQAGPAIGATFQKDKVGHSLMLRMSKPRRFGVNGGPVWWHHEDQAKFVQLIQYCMRDVETERDIASRLPPLPDDERQIWLMDARMNLRGFMLDIDLIRQFQGLIDVEGKRLSSRMAMATGGKVLAVNNVAKLTAWLATKGVTVPSLAKDDMADLLIDPSITGAPREALLIRKEAAKTSTAKLAAMLNSSGPDHRVRGLVMHYGAIRTGRWAGRLVQVQNLPRPAKGIDTDGVIALVKDGADADTVNFAYGAVLDAISSCLRACFVAKPGHTFAVCDYSAIEARVIAWLAGQDDILAVFASGEDVYVYTAKLIGSDDRQLGKVSVLGLGFGMGSTKFVDAAATYKITLTPDRAQEVVSAWRKANSKIVSFWYDLDRAARAAIEHGHETEVGHVTVRMAKGKLSGSMLIILPSGRHLVYRDARLEPDASTGKLSITYSGMNQYTRKWETLRTYGGKLAENVTQSVARCLLADAMLRMERNHLPIVASIHDEVVCEVPEAMATASFNQMKTIMSDGPAWADSLPLGGAGWIGKRYGKG